MTKPMISVIVPIYNTEKYLKRCIESIIHQNYDNIEIILVDDGSTDESGVIADEYAGIDERIRVFHKQNGGESSARNEGLKYANGDYVGFVDSDDWIEPDMYEKMVSAMEGDAIDLIVCNYFKEIDDKSVPMENAEPVSKTIFDKTQLLKYVYMRDRYMGVAGYCWNKLFRTETLKKNGGYIWFDTELRIGPDIWWFTQNAFNISRVKYVEKPLYHYVYREGSALHNKSLDKQMDLMKAYERIIGIIEEKKQPEETVVYIKRFMAYHASNIALLAYEQGDENILNKVQSVMKQYKSEYESTNTKYPERIKEYRRRAQLEI